MLTLAMAMIAQAVPPRELRRAPAAVRAFIERRAGCFHFAGEEAYDAARAREIDRAVKRLRCDAVAADEKRLRRRYARDRRVSSLLRRSADMLGS